MDMAANAFQSGITREMVFLIVDDFESMLKVMSAQLRSMGARTILEARNGADALHLLRTQHVDIVLSDWSMPVMTGIELLKEVRSDKKLSCLPFLMVTANAERHEINEAIANGVTDILVKPYTPEHLVSSLAKAFTMPPRPVRQVPPAAEKTEEAPATATPDAPVPVRVSREPEKARILIVDDMPANLQLLSQVFKDEYVVLAARNGASALELCQSDSPPDLVLLDIMMPDMDGFETTRRMREHPTSQSIPVIFVTAMTDEAARLSGFELGAVDFVTKPIDPAMLKLRVRNFLRYVDLHKQLQGSYDDMLQLARLQEDVEHITRHDMKGLLAGVIGLVQTLEEDSTTNTKQFETLRMVEETALQVLDMINLSSELFKIETGRFQLDPHSVKIGDVLRRITEIARNTFAEKKLVIQVNTNVPAGSGLPEVLGDAMFCYSLFQNLIRNACEAAPEKTRIIVTLYDETPLRITIQNKGVVPAEIRDRFFEKFVTFGKQGGTGLGTYSAKLLTEAQGGAIAMDVSDAEKQTTISVTLPRSFVIKGESTVFRAL